MSALVKLNTPMVSSRSVVPAATLRGDQLRAYCAIRSFLSKPQMDFPFFILSGYAGTGKTYLLSVLHSMGGLGHSVCVSPTNKATKVIKRTLSGVGYVECKTIYSLLGIKMVSDEDRLILEFPRIPTDLSGYDVIFVDESSMLNRQLTDYIIERAQFSPTKWILLGDKAQITPIGERISPIWRFKCQKVYLTEVKRHDNAILEIATHVRTQVTSYPNVDLQLYSDHTDTEGVWKFRREKFMHNMAAFAARGEFTKPDGVAAVAWRNRTVDELNAVIREAIFGKIANRTKWIVGDRLSVAEPLTEPGRVIAHIEDEGTVVSCEVVQHTAYKDMTVYYLVVDIDDGPTITLHVIHESCEAQLQTQLTELAVKAKADTSQWKYFWMMKNSFHRVRHAYAKTAHRVQGSTYNTVFCDTADILANSNTREALRCLYVAFTRPTTRLILT